MAAKSKTTCIGCGRDAGAPFQVHALPDGNPCPVCERRALEDPRGALPRPLAPFSYLPGGAGQVGPRRLVPGLQAVAQRYDEPPEPA